MTKKSTSLFKFEKLISDLNKYLSKKQLRKNDREKIVWITNEILNIHYLDYKTASPVLQDTIENLSVMDEHEGVKEPKILHMKKDQIGDLSHRLKTFLNQ